MASFPYFKLLSNNVKYFLGGRLSKALKIILSLNIYKKNGEKKIDEPQKLNNLNNTI